MCVCGACLCVSVYGVVLPAYVRVASRMAQVNTASQLMLMQWNVGLGCAKARGGGGRPITSHWWLAGQT